MNELKDLNTPWFGWEWYTWITVSTPRWQFYEIVIKVYPQYIQDLVDPISWFVHVACVRLPCNLTNRELITLFSTPARCDWDGWFTVFVRW